MQKNALWSLAPQGVFVGAWWLVSLAIKHQVRPDSRQFIFLVNIPACRNKVFALELQRQQQGT